MKTAISVLLLAMFCLVRIISHFSLFFSVWFFDILLVQVFKLNLSSMRFFQQCSIITNILFLPWKVFWIFHWKYIKFLPFYKNFEICFTRTFTVTLFESEIFVHKTWIIGNILKQQIVPITTVFVIPINVLPNNNCRLYSKEHLTKLSLFIPL